jgi:beta-glucanase (GH16 family)
MKKAGNMTFILFLFVMITGCGKKGGDTGPNPQLNFSDITVNEGNGGAGSIEVKLTLNRAPSKQVTVMYSTIEGTAKAAQDFTAATGQTITFQTNEKEKTITIPVVADDLKETDEIFQIRLDNPTNVTLLKQTGNITLKNDDTRIPFNNTGYDVPSTYPGYTLAWSDEFNGTTLDNASWSAEVGDGCPGLCGWGNNELEYYIAPPNNLFFQDGKMVIEARAEAYGGKNYTSSRIITRGKRSFKFGRIDIRAILPKGKGIWPAMWMMPQNDVFGGWPRSGEIDLMELVGHEAGKSYSTVHYGPGPGSINISRGYTLPTGIFNDQFHVFSMEWEQDLMKFYVDDNLFSTVTKADLGANNYPFNEQFYFIVNLAVGGNWPGPPDATTVFPQWLIVDYIRIYQK